MVDVGVYRLMLCVRTRYHTDVCCQCTAHTSSLATNLTQNCNTRYHRSCIVGQEQAPATPAGTPHGLGQAKHRICLMPSLIFHYLQKAGAEAPPQHLLWVTRNSQATTLYSKKYRPNLHICRIYINKMQYRTQKNNRIQKMGYTLT